MAGLPLVPDLPLFQSEAQRALRVFKRLRLPDVIGTPTMAEACGEWFQADRRGAVRLLRPGDQPADDPGVLPGDPEKERKKLKRRRVMVWRLIVNRRPEGEFLLDRADEGDRRHRVQAGVGTIKLDDELEKKFHIQRHIRKITHRETGATLQIKAADTDVITGSKAVGTMIDETHVFAKKPTRLRSSSRSAARWRPGPTGSCSRRRRSRRSSRPASSRPSSSVARECPRRQDPTAAAAGDLRTATSPGARWRLEEAEILAAGQPEHGAVGRRGVPRPRADEGGERGCPRWRSSPRSTSTSRSASISGPTAGRAPSSGKRQADKTLTLDDADRALRGRGGRHRRRRPRRPVRAGVLGRERVTKAMAALVHAWAHVGARAAQVDRHPAA
jgi:hypothetical protein